MREAKFRAWHKKLNIWVYFTLEDLIYGYVFSKDRSEKWRLTDASLLESEEQYTGLKDKNGVEIYEGDIIDADGVTWYVEFGNGQYVLRCTCHYPDGDFYIFEDSPTYKVIGNIYENPELLKDDQ